MGGGDTKVSPGTLWPESVKMGESQERGMWVEEVRSRRARVQFWTHRVGDVCDTFSDDYMAS